MQMKASKNKSLTDVHLRSRPWSNNAHIIMRIDQKILDHVPMVYLPNLPANALSSQTKKTKARLYKQKESMKNHRLFLCLISMQQIFLFLQSKAINYKCLLY